MVKALKIFLEHFQNCCPGPLRRIPYMEVGIRIGKQRQRSSVFNTPVIAIQFPLLTAGHFDATEIVGRTIMYSTGFQFLAISLWARVPNSRRVPEHSPPCGMVLMTKSLPL